MAKEIGTTESGRTLVSGGRGISISTIIKEVAWHLSKRRTKYCPCYTKRMGGCGLDLIAEFNDIDNDGGIARCWEHYIDDARKERIELVKSVCGNRVHTCNASTLKFKANLA